MDDVDSETAARNPPDHPAVGVDVETDGDGPDSCTLWAADVPEEKLTTAWMSAEGDAFVSLPEMR